MSALRVSRPGQPVVLIDQGPATARVMAGRYATRGSIGGEYVTAKPAPTPNAAYRAANPERVAEAQRAYRARKAS